MRILVLEDDSYRITTFIEKFCDHDLTITENAKDAIIYLADREFDCLFLDHDLELNNGSGTDVATFLSNNPENPNNKSRIIIHSWNKPATDGMISKLYGAVHVPFNTGDFFALTIDK